MCASCARRSAVLYAADYAFEFGKGHVLRQSPADAAAVDRQQRPRRPRGAGGGGGVRRTAASASAWSTCRRSTKSCCSSCAESGRLICFAEQNNGYILQNLLKVLYRRCPDVASAALQRVVAINTLDADGRPAFIHSGDLRRTDRGLRAHAGGDRRRRAAGGSRQERRDERTGDARKRRRGTRSSPAGDLRWLVAAGADPGRPLLDVRDRRAARRTGAPGALASERRRGHLHHPRLGPGAGRQRSEPGARGLGRAVPAAAWCTCSTTPARTR